MRLFLEDGTVLEGERFGALRSVAGEVVFNTGMTGYVEALTDPSYRGQILVLTYPLVGNYGVPAPRPAGSIDGPYESDRIQVQALIVQSYVDTPSHHASVRTLSEWMKSEGVPGIFGVDTRALTQRLRERGTMQGVVAPPTLSEVEARASAHSVDMKRELFRLVAPTQPIHYPGEGPHILVVDAGAKDNIIRSLLKRGARVTRAPWHADLDSLSKDVDGILLGNGPGDPKDLESLIVGLRTLLETFLKPVFGVCLGNQILALAVGGDTQKLLYGHRGVNQPVRDLRTGRCYVTSQNHGYAVDGRTLPEEFEPWFVNLNDGTNEGVRSKRRPLMSVQFHPEASPGPRDTEYLFDEFMTLVREYRR